MIPSPHDLPNASLEDMEDLRHSDPPDPYDEDWRDREIDERGLPPIPDDDSDWLVPQP